MNIIFGDIGNTLTKICLADNKKLKVKKVFYFKSKEILSKKILNKNFKKILKNKTLDKIAIFSSVVPKYELILKKFLKKFYSINLNEIKKSPINKLVKIKILNKVLQLFLQSCHLLKIQLSAAHSFQPLHFHSLAKVNLVGNQLA